MPLASRARPDSASPAHPRAGRVGCVSFLNAKPLIHGFEDAPDAPGVRFEVPSGLLDLLEDAEVDLALCPVIDFQRSDRPLELVPVGGIGCEGVTLTVRLYSPIPLREVRCVRADADSHTSVALLRVLMHELHGLKPELIDGLDAPHPAHAAALHIGDKVVTHPPDPRAFPYTLDLGEAWNRLTGLPFVFAVWMTRDGLDLGDLPGKLAALREANLAQVHRLAAQYAPLHGWPEGLARRYLGEWLRYRVGPRELRAIERFFQLAHRAGVIPSPRPLKVRLGVDAG